jgi:hypothetical protein
MGSFDLGFTNSIRIAAWPIPSSLIVEAVYHKREVATNNKAGCALLVSLHWEFGQCKDPCYTERTRTEFPACRPKLERRHLWSSSTGW